MSSAWINLDQSFGLTSANHGRPKRIRRNIVSREIPIIEDDNSQEKFPNSNLSSISPKRRRIKPLVTITKCDQQDSSNESVEYNPDATQHFMDEVKPPTVKPEIPLSLATTMLHLPPLSTSESKSSSKLHFNNWKALQDTFGEHTNLSDSIVECSDSDESSPSGVPIPLDTMIDECSTDGSQIPSLVVQESIIETQESITPPAEPFQIKKLPKKRKVRFVKGGMVERLTKCLSKAKSNLLFWQHHRSADLISPGIVVSIELVEKTYGRTLLHCKIDETPTIFCVHQEGLQLKKDDMIEVQLDRRRSYKIGEHIMYSYVDKILQIK